jgi:hypothetical protein
MGNGGSKGLANGDGLMATGDSVLMLAQRHRDKADDASMLKRAVKEHATAGTTNQR